MAKTRELAATHRPRTKQETLATRISVDWLCAESNPKSFDRARDYAGDNAVTILHWSEQEIIAEMYGTQPYAVTLRLGGKAIIADCTCPARHDYPGLCKHIVGLGFYVIANRDDPADFPRLKDQVAAALKNIPAMKLQELCLSLTMMNRNFRDRMLAELDIPFESRLD